MSPERHRLKTTCPLLIQTDRTRAVPGYPLRHSKLPLSRGANARAHARRSSSPLLLFLFLPRLRRSTIAIQNSIFESPARVQTSRRPRRAFIPSWLALRGWNSRWSGRRQGTGWAAGQDWVKKDEGRLAGWSGWRFGSSSGRAAVTNDTLRGNGCESDPFAFSRASESLLKSFPLFLATVLPVLCGAVRRFLRSCAATSVR